MSVLHYSSFHSGTLPFISHITYPVPGGYSVFGLYWELADLENITGVTVQQNPVDILFMKNSLHFQHFVISWFWFSKSDLFLIPTMMEMEPKNKTHNALKLKGNVFFVVVVLHWTLLLNYWTDLFRNIYSSRTHLYFRKDFTKLTHKLEGNKKQMWWVRKTKKTL